MSKAKGCCPAKIPSKKIPVTIGGKLIGTVIDFGSGSSYGPGYPTSTLEEKVLELIVTCAPKS